MMQRSIRCLAMLAAVSLLAFGCSSGDEEEPGGEPSVGSPDGGAGSGSGGGGSQAGEGGGAGTGAEAGSGAGSAGDGSMPSDAGQTPIPDPVPDVSVAELPEVFAEAVCSALEGCVGAAALRELTAREACEVRIAAELRATEFHHLEASIRAGRLLYDPDELSSCLEGVSDLGCRVLTDSFPDPCAQVLAGNVELGGTCAVSAECQGIAFCAGAANNQCPSVCTELLGEGAACSADNECGDALLCVGGECARPSAASEPCAGQSGRICALGFSCLGSTDTEAGACTANAEVQTGDEDDACEPGGALCKEGLSCVFDDVGAFHCKPYVAAGEACHLGLPGQCPAEQYCDAADVTAAGTCRPLPGDGTACVLSGLCAPGHACVPDGAAAVCGQIRDNGGECAGDATCRSGLCVAGTCEPPPVCGE